MKYPESVYKNFGHFLAQAIESVKDRIGLYNHLIDPPTRRRLTGNGFQQFLQAVLLILRKGSWYVFMVLAGLIGLGLLGFVGGTGTLIALNPILAAGLVTIGGGGIYLLWRNREVLMAQEKIGVRYKVDFDSICEKHPDVETRAPHIEKLMRQCVRSLCTEAFNINSDEFINKAEEEA